MYLSHVPVNNYLHQRAYGIISLGLLLCPSEQDYSRNCEQNLHKTLVRDLFLQCFDTVGWVIWPVKTRPHMTYNVFGGTLSLTQSINQSLVRDTPWNKNQSTRFWHWRGSAVTFNFQRLKNNATKFSLWDLPMTTPSSGWNMLQNFLQSSSVPRFTLYECCIVLSPCIPLHCKTCI